MNAHFHPVALMPLLPPPVGANGGQFHGVEIPAESQNAQLFYRGLPGVGWAVREACHQQPGLPREQVLELGLRALLDYVLERPESTIENFELTILGEIERVLSATFQGLRWRASEPAAPVGPVPLPEVTDGERRPLILVADDCQVSSFVITTELRKAGMDSLVVTNGADALLMAPFCWPDLILMDVQMDYLSGVEACSILQQSQLVGRPPIIFLSGHTEKGAIVKGFMAGGADYITKPFEPREGLARIRAHLQLRQLQVQLEANNLELRRANVAKDRILSVTSHDLRSPLAAVRGLAEYLCDGSLGPVNAQQAETLQCLAGSVEGMLALVNDLMDVSTLDNETMKLECAPVDLGPLLHWVTWIHTPTAARKAIRLCLDSSAASLVCNGDEQRLKRVLENLVMNAIKFSPHDSTIRLGAWNDDGMARVWVDDEGPGVPSNEQAKLFTDYGRTSIRPTGGESSTGLGLAICRRIVAAHGGRISMRNRDTGGARFEFCLPALMPKVTCAEAQAA